MTYHIVNAEGRRIDTIESATYCKALCLLIEGIDLGEYPAGSYVEELSCTD